MAILAILVIAFPVQAAFLFGVSTDVELKEPFVVTLAADTPVIPEKIWPGETLEWKFNITNVSPNDYWAIAGLGWSSQNSFWVESTGVRLGSNILKLHDPILIPAGTTKTITIYVVIGEESSSTEKIIFSPSINRTKEPERMG